MYLALIGADHKTAHITLREQISLTANSVAKAVQALKIEDAVSGAVILSTCNRTELYLASPKKLSAAQLKNYFCRMTHTTEAGLTPHFYIKRDEALTIYLFELACGLHSMILGEDQIITQVGDALTLTIEADAGCPVLNTLFRHAVTCAKKAKTNRVLRQVSPSSVTLARKLLAPYFREHPVPSVLVIGNGEMGRLAAEEFYKAGCRVCMTLRSYKYTAAVIPEGCSVVPYENRAELLIKADIVISATKSPHYTLTYSMLADSPKRPAYIFDLALPRDVDPQIHSLPDIRCYDVDSIGGSQGDPEGVRAVQGIIRKQLQKFSDWSTYQEQHREAVSVR